MKECLGNHYFCPQMGLGLIAALINGIISHGAVTAEYQQNESLTLVTVIK